MNEFRKATAGWSLGEIQHKAESQEQDGMRLLIHPVDHELVCSNLGLPTRKLTASTKSTPCEFRFDPYDLIGPTALREHTSEDSLLEVQ